MPGILKKTGRRIHHLFIPTRGNDYHPHVFRRSGLRIVLVLMLAVEGFLVASVITQQSGVNFLAAVEPGTVIALINGERTQNNLTALSDNRMLDAAAQAKAADMAAKGYFLHIGQDGKKPWDWISQYGYNYKYAGENLAVRFTDSNDAVNAWMASATHRANILKTQYSDTGVGVAEGVYQGQPATFIVQYFASPAEQNTAPAGAPSSASVAGAVEGDSMAPPTSYESAGNSLSRALLRIVSSPEEDTLWFFSILAALLIVGITFTLIARVRARLRPGKLLLGGMTLAVFAFSIVAFNSHFFSSTSVGTLSGAASVALTGTPAQGVVISATAASTKR